MRVAVIGGGAAGFFGAITCAELRRDARVIIFERGKSVLEKVRISGGGRCNVTHACFDARELVKNYPRGSRELLGPFTKFGPANTVDWFEHRGVRLKTEADGRMFPTTDSSQTIIDCLTRTANAAGVQVRTGARVEHLSLLPSGEWSIGAETFDRVLVATGSNAAILEKMQTFGHTVVPMTPSLFTFNTKDARLRELSGVSVPKASLHISNTKITASGPLLVTHWGLSGPAVLRISAWGARELHALNYKFELAVNFINQTPDETRAFLQQLKTEMARKAIATQPPATLPQRLWQRLTEAAGIDPQRRWADLTKMETVHLVAQLCDARFQITGKSTFKEEFVTAGGISLKELNFNTFESKIHPGLHFAGEILDIDAITGGFNFQAAWTGGWLAGQAMAAR